MKSRNALKAEHETELQKAALTKLSAELTPRGLITVLIVDQTGRAALEVLDARFRPRRVYAHLPFRWFYWGEEKDERASLLQIPQAADQIEAAARAGWREGEQGDISTDLSKIADAYRQ
ncbi:hypothetical protein [Herbidospora cretacea]|uniref:hypothetical protein n=1 Tax=Herbidospora cretacea TaxID=28444 RepID=UPI0007730A1F|nr:hypothetical protein [Herbidospora cretacea]